jgi:hypothetical protein
LNPVGNDLTVVEEFGLVDFDVPFQCFGSLGTKDLDVLRKTYL